MREMLSLSEESKTLDASTDRAQGTRDRNVRGMLSNRPRSLRVAYRTAILLAALGLSPALFAHTASLSWTNSPDTTSTNVYRLTGACPTGTTGFTKLTPTPVTTGNYTDSTVLPGAYCYYVTATLNGVESVPSSTIQANVPVAPPSGLAITSVAKVINPDGTETILAKWTDTNQVGQHFSFTDGDTFLGQGLTSSLTGTFAETLTVPSGTAVTFLVCDAMASCASQQAQ